MGQNDERFFRKLIEDGQLTRRTLLKFGIGAAGKRRSHTLWGPIFKGGEA